MSRLGGNPGYSHNKTMERLVGMCAREALAVMEAPKAERNQELWEKILLQIIGKVAPQNINFNANGKVTVKFQMERAKKYVEFLKAQEAIDRGRPDVGESIPLGLVQGAGNENKQE